MMEEGVKVDHSTINKWVLKHTPKILKRFQRRKLPVGSSWRLDETYIKVAGQWLYLYRAVDKDGYTIDFHFSRKRTKRSVYKFLKKAIENNGIPEIINIDKSGSNLEGIKLYN